MNGPAETLVVAAMTAEIRPLARRLGLARASTSPDGRRPAVELEGRPVSLVVSGSGAEAAGRGLATAISQRPVGRVVGVGVAGALTAGLEIGDLVAPTEIRTPERTVWMEPQRDGAAGREGPVVLISAPSILAKASEKRALAARLSVGEVPTAVDLESAAWSEAAAAAAVPFTVVRAISDRLDEDLPLDFEPFRDRRGRLMAGRVALHAVTRPGLWKPLSELRRRLRLCAERLADQVVRELMR